MTIFRFVRILFLALYWKLPQGKELVWSSQESAITRNLNKEKKKRQRRQLRKVRQLPPREKRRISRGNYHSTKPKDVRFSDQRKLRRMYRNS